jgi:DNA (cytosine-5)-methyltransferase 1
MFKYGSLFSGVGGFDMGFDQESYECVFQVEWDKNCQQILAKHWPEVPKWSDAREVVGAELPPCDVLIFGSPCQDLSVAGKRGGLEGDRSVMFYEATRIIKEMRDATNNVYPRVVVWENVTGAITSNNGQDFAQVLDTLADIGSVDIQWAVLDAINFGVPQRRRRIFVVGTFDPAAAARGPSSLLPVTKGRRGDIEKSRKAAEAISTSGVQSSEDSSGEEIIYSFDTQFGSNAAIFENFLPTLKSSQQAPTVVIDGRWMRRLTPLECERAMGWPDDHTRWTADGKEQVDTVRLSQCGNGVVTPVAKWVAKHVKAIL